MAKRQTANGVTSNVLRVLILDSASSVGAGKTGLTEASAGMIIGTITDNEATTTRYRASSTEIETITTLGTYAAPTSGKCRFKEVDATNHPGIYEIQLADARYAVASARMLLVSIAGASGAAPVHLEVQLDPAPADVTLWKGATAPAMTGDAFARLGAPAGASVSADVAAVKGVLPSALVGGRIDASVGAMAANVLTAAAINADAFTAAKFAADVTTELQTGLATATAVSTLQTSVDDLPTNAELATALGTADDAVLAQVALVKAKTDNLPTDPADASDIAAAFGTVNTTLGTIAGYIDTEVGALTTAVADIPTNAELATALGTADDAVLAAIGGLTIPTATQNADALLNRDMAAVSDTESRSPLNALRFIRNGFGIVGATLTVLKEDDTTPAYTRTLTTDAGAVPIVGVD